MKNLIEQLMPNYRDLAITHTAIEMAAMHDMHADTVRRFLYRNGVEAARYCKKCRKNRRPEDFLEPAHRSCKRHERDESGRNPNRGMQAVWERALWEEIREKQSLASCWIATEEGQPNGALPGWA